jgi:hypothetical protein
MQELPESVRQMVGTVYAMLTATKTPAADHVGLRRKKPAQLVPVV